MALEEKRKSILAGAFTAFKTQWRCIDDEMKLSAFGVTTSW